MPLQLKLSESLPAGQAIGPLRLSMGLAPATRRPRIRLPNETGAVVPAMRLAENLQSDPPNDDSVADSLLLAAAITSARQALSEPARRDGEGGARPLYALVPRREGEELAAKPAAASGRLALDLPAASPFSMSAAEVDEDDELPAPLPGRGPQGTPPGAESELPDLSAEEWGLAPIRWGGVMGWGVNRSISDKHDFSSAVSQTNAVQASSYVYQPWFAQATGNANYGTVRSWARSHGNHDGDTSSDGKTYSFGGGLNLFPQSHFPIQTYYNFNRNKSQSEEESSKSISTNFGLQQSYSPRGSTDRYSYSYNRVSSKLAGPNTLTNALNGDYSTNIEDEHTLNASLRYSDEEKGAEDVMGQRLTLTGNHVWRYEDGLRFNSNATITQSEDDVFQALDRAKTRSMVSQFNSSFDWQPFDEDDEPLPMVINGSGTFLNIEQDAPDASKNRLTLLSGNTSMVYRFTDRLSGNASLNLTRVDANSVQSTSYGAGAGVSYAGAPTQLGDFVHTWNTGAGGNLAYTSNMGGTDNVRANFGQGLTLPFAGATLMANQSLSGVRTSSYGVVNTLTHSLGMMRQFGSSEIASGSVSANYSHNKTASKLGGQVNSFTLTGSGQVQLSRRQSLGINANVSWMKQVQQKQDLSPSLLVINNSLVDVDEARWVGAATFSYNHVAPFSIMNLNYAANLSFTSAETSQQPTLAAFGFGGLANTNFAAGNERHWIHTMIFNHGLQYRIGRLNLQLANILQRVDGVDNVIIFGQLTRNIGNF